ncbi:hypothetical protein D5S17_35910 [Pseudonocardiaceae bacterium YIM PH 21723]|nr:hypothetical protein D5S17_35910 [Pseudonocardiaceae bacterium YIM PH 21723]
MKIATTAGLIAGAALVAVLTATGAQAAEAAAPVAQPVTAQHPGGLIIDVGAGGGLSLDLLDLVDLEAGLGLGLHVGAGDAS